MKDALKIICKSNIYLYRILTKLKNIFIRFKHRNDIKIISKSTLISIKKDCIGNDNLMIIEPECIIKPLTIHVRGNNNRINIGISEMSVAYGLKEIIALYRLEKVQL